MEISKKCSTIARGLLSIGAVAVSVDTPYTWASGMKSPIYCDNRITLGFPDFRNQIAAFFAETIDEKSISFDIIAGTATAGIPHAAVLATHENKPMCYVRSSAKEHGRKNVIEGPPVDGKNVVVIEDLISTGMSSLRVAEAIQEAGGSVSAVLAIFTYGFPFATEAFAKAGIPLHVLTDYDSLLQAALDNGSIADEDIDRLKRWRNNPQEWGAHRG